MVVWAAKVTLLLASLVSFIPPSASQLSERLSCSERTLVAPISKADLSQGCQMVARWLPDGGAV